jgi:lysophospholipase L1-like esterase
MAATRRTRWGRRIAGLLLSFATAFFAGELLCRLLLADRLGYTVDERNLTYRHDARLGWFHEPDSEREFRGSRAITVRHNAKGFRDRDHGVKRGPRLAFFSDSFTRGYDVEQSERFTERLQAMVPEWEVLNFGISGYGTDQALLLMQDVFDEYRPDVVLLVVTHTDVEDNASSVRYGGYHKPWFEVEDGALILKGVPVPRSENHLFARSALLHSSYLVRALVRTGRRIVEPEPVRAAAPYERTRAILSATRDEVRSRGAELVVGREATDPRVAELVEEAGIPHVDLTGAERYPGQGEHWTPTGHADVADRIRSFLVERRLLERAGR